MFADIAVIMMDGIGPQIPSVPKLSVEYDTLTNREQVGGGNAGVTKATLPTPDRDVFLAIKEPRLSETIHADQVKRRFD